MKLSIIIPVWNNWNFTKACLNDLRKLAFRSDHEVIIVNNGSTDDTRQGFRADFGAGSGFEMLNLDSNTGFAHACNYGYKHSSGNNIMFLNNDIRVKSNHDNWTDEIIIECNKKNYLVGPTGGILDSDLNFIKELNELREGNFYMSGWCLSASRDTYDKLILDEYDGPFTEEFTTYFEDTDLSFRAKELDMNFKIVDVPIVHFGKMTSKKLNTLNLYLPAKRKFIDKWKDRL